MHHPRRHQVLLFPRPTKPTLLQRAITIFKRPFTCPTPARDARLLESLYARSAAITKRIAMLQTDILGHQRYCFPVRPNPYPDHLTYAEWTTMEIWRKMSDVAILGQVKSRVLKEARVVEERIKAREQKKGKGA